MTAVRTQHENSKYPYESAHPQPDLDFAVCWKQAPQRESCHYALGPELRPKRTAVPIWTCASAQSDMDFDVCWKKKKKTAWELSLPLEKFDWKFVAFDMIICHRNYNLTIPLHIILLDLYLCGSNKQMPHSFLNDIAGVCSSACLYVTQLPGSVKNLKTELCSSVKQGLNYTSSCFLIVSDYHLMTISYVINSSPLF